LRGEPIEYDENGAVKTKDEKKGSFFDKVVNKLAGG
jgi:hypothetical protein